MQNILLTVSYDGTDFCGWQRQDKSDYGNPVRTVQGEIETALYKMFSKKIPLYGSGRTDSGVHAFAQKANFFSPVDSIPQKNYVRALNSFLPRDIRITKAEYKDENFNSRFSAVSRTYRYFINTSGVMTARDSRYVWALGKELDLDLLNQMCGLLKGEKDFKTFAAAGDASLSTFRYVKDAFFFRQDEDTAVFQIEANAFLWKMVRSLTGTLVTLSLRKKTVSDFNRILESRERKNALLTAPPEGLFLYDVSFEGQRVHI